MIRLYSDLCMFLAMIAIVMALVGGVTSVMLQEWSTLEWQVVCVVWVIVAEIWRRTAIKGL